MKHLITTLVLATTLLAGCKESMLTKPDVEVEYSIADVCPHAATTMEMAEENGFKIYKDADFAARDEICLSKSVKSKHRFLSYIYSPDSDIDLLYKADGTLMLVSYCFWFTNNDDAKHAASFDVVTLFRQLYGKPVGSEVEYIFRHGPYRICVKEPERYAYVSISFSGFRNSKLSK